MDSEKQPISSDQTLEKQPPISNESGAGLSDLDILAEILKATCELLLDRIKKGVATPGDLQVARGLLNDNNITATPKAVKALEPLKLMTDQDSEDMAEATNW